MIKPKKESFLEGVVSDKDFEEKGMEGKLLIRALKVYSFVNEREGYIAEKIGRKYRIIGCWVYE